VSARPLIVAHRGASARAPEHSRPAYVAALDEGADVVETDVVCSADGVLVARHDWGLGATTDVWSRPELHHARETRRTPDGMSDDVWADLMTWDELGGLRCRERWRDLRPASAALDDRSAVLRLADVLALAREQSEHRDRAVGVAIEVKTGPPGRRPGTAALVDALMTDLAATETPCAGVPVWVLAFDAALLGELRRRQPHSPSAAACALVLLLEHQVPAGATAWRAAVASCDMVGVEMGLLLRSVGARAGEAVMAEARAHDLGVWTWTLRAENAFLPVHLRRGTDAAGLGHLDVIVREALDLALEGLVGDQPALLRRLASVV
jgi:glycerophosphoryl diester phosphodiesterase